MIFDFSTVGRMFTTSSCHFLTIKKTEVNNNISIQNRKLLKIETQSLKVLTNSK